MNRMVDRGAHGGPGGMPYPISAGAVCPHSDMEARQVDARGTRLSVSRRVHKKMICSEGAR
jgi:hypothetical protein